MQTKQTNENNEAMQEKDAQLISLLKDIPDILLRHPELIADLELTHTSGDAISLIERQVTLLREKLRSADKRLRELMDIARDNERIANSRHRLAINLLGAHDLDDVISIVLNELSNELNAEFAVIKLFSKQKKLIEQSPELYVAAKSKPLNAFSTMMKHQNPMCGRCSDEQKTFIFGDNANQIGSAAVIPLVAGADLGLLGLGAKEKERFQASMGTDFLKQIGELVSAAFAVHLEK